MARKKQQLINYHTGSKQSMPLSSEVQYGELVVRHNAEKPELLIKVADDKFATFVDVNAVAQKIQDSTDSLNSAISAVSASVIADFATMADVNTVSGNIESTLNAVKSALEGADSVITSGLSAMSASVIANKSEFDGYKSANDAKVNALGSASAALQTSLTKLSGATSAFSGVVVSEIVRLDGRVDSAFTSAVTVASAYTDGQIAGVKGEIDAVEEEVGKLKSSAATLSTSLTELSGATSAFSGAVVSEIVRLDGEIASAKTEAISEAYAAASAYTDAKIKLVNDINDGLGDRVNELESGVTELSTTISEFSGSVVSAITLLDGRVDSAFTSAVTYVDVQVSAVTKSLQDKEDALDTRIKAVEVLTGTSESGVTSIVNKAITNVVSGAPAAFDTLKEIADWILQGSGATAAEIVTDIKNLKTADSVITSGLSAVSAIVIANKSEFDGYKSANDAKVNALGSASAALQTSLTELSGATSAFSGTVVSEIVRLDGRVDSAFTSAVTVASAYTDGQIAVVKGQIDTVNSRVNSLESISANTRIEKLETSAITSAEVVVVVDGEKEECGVEVSVNKNKLTLDFTNLVIDCGEF